MADSSGDPRDTGVTVKRARRRAYIAQLEAGVILPDYFAFAD